jgi:hypothetical protein
MKPGPETDANSLLERVRAKRLHIISYVNRVEPSEPRENRLSSLGIVCSALATLLTAGPAIGGESFTKALGAAGPNSPSWRILCGGAMMFSLAAAVASKLYKSHDIAARLSKAQACDAKLGAIETLLEVGRLSLKDAATRYEKCILEVPFIALTEKQQRRRLQQELALKLIKGKIRLPISEQAVGGRFLCSGSASGLQEGAHLWLAVEIDGRIWPKESEVHVEEDGSWSKTVFEQGTAGKFSLSLLAANAEGNEYIRAWLRLCDQTGSYPELRAPELIPLARINGLCRDLPSIEAAGVAP